MYVCSADKVTFMIFWGKCYAQYDALMCLTVRDLFSVDLIVDVIQYILELKY